MKFTPRFDLGDIAGLFVLITALIGLLFTWMQLRKNDRTQRDIFFKDLYSLLFFNDELHFAFQVLENGPIEFVSSFHGSGEAKAIDKLLSHCELVSALYNRGSLSEEEMVHFDYNLERVYTNSNVVRYFSEVIDPWAKKKGLSIGPFSVFRSVAKQRFASNTN